MIKKILLVEDNETNRDMLARNLERNGFTVITANDGQQAINLATFGKPELILMDMSLPLMDGWQVSQKIRDNPQTSNILIIAMTAHAILEDAEHALRSGCDDYEVKPIDYTRLLNKIIKLQNTK